MKSKFVLFLECIGLLGVVVLVIFFAQRAENNPVIASKIEESARARMQDSEAPQSGPATVIHQPDPNSKPPRRRKKQMKQERFRANLERAYPGFTLYPEAGSALVRLLNMKGETVHSWQTDAMRARLLENCNLLVIHGTKWGLKTEPWRSWRNRITEYDWNGKVVWTHDADNVVHHDLRRLENGNTLFLKRVLVPQMVKDKIKDPKRRYSNIRTDAIYEITPAGEIVWDWYAYQHFDPNTCGGRPCPEVKKIHEGDDTIDWTHTNTLFPLPENKWFDQGDQRFRPGNILILPRNFWTAMIIDRETGDVVWEYSGDYKGGLSGGHEAQMIEKGLPGAGNIMIFDNGRDKKTSFAIEIDPTTKKIEWVYDAGKEFFSQAAGSLQRFPNGNTLVSEDVTGRVFEVTKEKEIVWEFRGDYRSARAQRYEQNYCAQLGQLSLM